MTAAKTALLVWPRAGAHRDANPAGRSSAGCCVDPHQRHPRRAGNADLYWRYRVDCGRGKSNCHEPPALRSQPGRVTEILAAGPAERVVFLPANPPARRLAEALVALGKRPRRDGALRRQPEAEGHRPGRHGCSAPAAASSCRKRACSPRRRSSCPSPCSSSSAGRPSASLKSRPACPTLQPQRPLSHPPGATGPTNRLLSASELTALLLSRAEAGFEARPAPGASLSDLDIDAVSLRDRLPGWWGKAGSACWSAAGCLTAAGARRARDRTDCQHTRASSCSAGAAEIPPQRADHAHPLSRHRRWPTSSCTAMHGAAARADPSGRDLRDGEHAAGHADRRDGADRK